MPMMLEELALGGTDGRFIGKRCGAMRPRSSMVVISADAQAPWLQSGRSRHPLYVIEKNSTVGGT